MIHPFADIPTSDPQDLELVRQVHAGSRSALEQLVTRHQPWIYNIVLRMLYHPADAEDATQEILIKLVTKLSTFEARSSFRTWLYRITVNHILNVRRDKLEQPGVTFTEYAKGLDATPDSDIPDPSNVPADMQLLVAEAQIGCTSGMLLCLSAEQRLVYILGEILGVSDAVGAELLEVSRDNFRQKLTRARRDLHSFMQGQCGLVNTANPCRCARKADGFAKAGYLDPQKLIFAKERMTRVKEVTEKALEGLESLDRAYGEIYRNHPFHQAPDFVALLRGLLNRPEIKSVLELH